ncbi:DNA/RNA non-specific endonuclease [Nitrosomonas sp.]|uniref:DNA/RNA non-specific endonuclease n=1 Tax=Nitrosomonas sp. TaxID=42353 RepID=UPI001D576256|nr:DNA/RNA non-specific endonuclease [Nitrosomonas sp.]MBX3616359.1 DNA/RNA non-specific endonuclease [Nitrosomonas sp.]
MKMVLANSKKAETPDDAKREAKSQAGYTVNDQRPESIALNRLNTAMSASSRVQQLKKQAQRINNSLQSQTQYKPHSAAIGRVVQRTFDATVAAMHPMTGKPAILNLFDNVNGIYQYTGSIAFFFKPATNEYFDSNQKPMPGPADFDEDKAAINPTVGGSNIFRKLKFTVDSFNRVIGAEGQIYKSGTTPESGRSSDAQSGAWDHVQGIHRRMFKPLKEFNGGHIIAHHFGGSPGTDNMVPMEKVYNQAGSYKQFENELDEALENESPLSINIQVGYATDFDDLMNQLVKKDDADKRTDIKNDPATNSMIMRTLGRIPKTIHVVSLTDSSLSNVAITDPDSPMDSLQGTIPRNFSTATILLEEFSKVGKGREGEGTSKTFKPFEKSYGPKKGESIAKDKTYQSDYQSLYGAMPRPGITEYLAGNNGLAGGVRAYVWMDPMGIYNRFGGSDTIDTVDPLGTDWAYLRKAVNFATGGDKIYKKGHLLNAGLHGPGADSRNLLPITTRANGEMSRNFEEIVKKSEALINPQKGVLWETRTGGGNVTRPFGWDRHAAGLQNSAKLFDEEVKLPQYLDCNAWEAIQYHSGLQKGRLIASYRAWNGHPNDPNGVLGKTLAGGQANDAGIANTIKQGDNNVTGHEVVPLPADASEAYEKGYQMDGNWLQLNLGKQKDFLEGLGDRAFDTGFAQQPKPNQFGWPLLATQTYDKYFVRGQLKFSHAHGLHDEVHEPVNPNQVLADSYNQGRYDRGRAIGKLLGDQPDKANLNDLIQEGYFDGLYSRGKQDATEDKVAASDKKDYLEGYWKIYQDKAYDHGYDCDPFPQNLPNIYFQKFNSAYREGQDARGFHDGYDIKPSLDNQSQEYYLGWEEGIEKRGYEDGYDLEDEASAEQDYAKGYYDGVFERGKDDGYDAEDEASQDNVYLEGYSQGAHELSQDEGYDLIPHHETSYITNQGDSHTQAYAQGMYERGKDDGYNLVARKSNNLTYRNGYEMGLFERGQSDSNDVGMRMSNERSYLDGFGG